MTGVWEAAGDLATGGLIGRALEPSAGEAGHGDAHHGLCLNCGTALRGDFCYRCGQAGHVHRTMASIGHDLLHSVWHFEGKIWTTLPMLFTRPGQLTRRYIAGERARFVSPLALFLFSIFLMFATIESIGGPLGGNNGNARQDGVVTSVSDLEQALLAQENDEKKLIAERDTMLKSGRAPAALAKLDRKLAAVREDLTGMRSALAISRGDLAKATKGININTGVDWFDYRANKAAKDPRFFLYKLQSSIYKYSWALIPISVPFIWLLFPFRREFGPYDHAIFAIYSLSAMTMGAVGLSVLRAIGLPMGMIATIFVLGPPYHMYRQLRGAYNITRFAALWRTFALLAFSIISGLIFFVTILGIVS